MKNENKLSGSRTRGSDTVNAKDRHWTLYAASSIQLPSTQPISLNASQYCFRISSQSYTVFTSKKFIFQMFS